MSSGHDVSECELGTSAYNLCFVTKIVEKSIKNRENLQDCWLTMTVHIGDVSKCV
jgi:hypothetical protein